MRTSHIFQVSLERKIVDSVLTVRGFDPPVQHDVRRRFSERPPRFDQRRQVPRDVLLARALGNDKATYM